MNDEEHVELKLIRMDLASLREDVKKLTASVNKAEGRDRWLLAFGPILIAIVGLVVFTVIWSQVRENTREIQRINNGKPPITTIEKANSVARVDK
jgi:hypothetical protein